MTINHRQSWWREWGIFWCVSGLALFSIAATVVVKISDFPNTASLNNTDQFLIGEPNVTNKNITWAQLRALIGTNGTQVFNINTNYTTNAFITFMTVTTNFVDYSFTTNLFVTEIRAGKMFVTNLTFVNLYPITNTWANFPTGTVDLAIMDQYIVTAQDMSITGFANRSNTVAESVVMTITNSAAANKTMYLPNASLPDRTASFTVSNASFGVLSIRYHPLGGTNYIWKQW